MTQPTSDTQKMLDSLRAAVAEAVERKRRPGLLKGEGDPLLGEK
nr:hypothetical protein [uncultured Halomonas sp.]